MHTGLTTEQVESIKKSLEDKIYQHSNGREFEIRYSPGGVMIIASKKVNYPNRFIALSIRNNFTIIMQSHHTLGSKRGIRVEYENPDWLKIILEHIDKAYDLAAYHEAFLERVKNANNRDNCKIS